MAQYRLPYVTHKPAEETGWTYMVEIPVLPGCRAWGATEDEAVTCLQDVAEQFIISFREHGEELPDEVTALRDDVEQILVNA